jgi:hypothetical protein
MTEDSLTEAFKKNLESGLK